MPQAATPSSVRVRWMNSRTAGSLYQRLAEDGRNNDVLTAFETALDQAE